jgi:hypothetical protein
MYVPGVFIFLCYFGLLAMLDRAHVGELNRIQILVSNFIGGSFSAF